MDSKSVLPRHDISCVPIQGLHPSKDSFEGQSRHNAARRPVPIHPKSKDSPNAHSKCVLLFSRWVPLRRTHRYYPSRAPASQDALRAAAAQWRFTTSKEVKMAATSGDTTHKCKFSGFTSRIIRFYSHRSISHPTPYKLYPKFR